MKTTQRLLKSCLVVLAMGGVSTTAMAEEYEDWRKSATQEEKIENMVKVLPGASVVMLQMGERYKNLYWAAKKGKWEFAEYQMEEMDDLINTLIITRPKRAKTAKIFMESAFSQFEPTIENKSWPEFRAAFEHMRQQCMACHTANDHAFIVLPKKPPMGSSPVLAD